MSSSPRAIVIDDTDTRIQYTGQGWFQDSGSQDGAGNFGPSYLHTEHGTNGNDSFAFSFTGTSVTVSGTTALSQIPIVNGTGNGTTWDPKWECFVDGVSIGSTNPFPYAENNWVLCDKSHLTDGPHTLTVNVTTMGNTFWLDQVQFTPSPGASYGNGTNVVLVRFIDPGIEYGPGWGSLGGAANFTTKLGSQMKFNFTGTSLSWLGFIPTELSHNASAATYAIDGGSPVYFKLNGLSPTGTVTVYNQVFFTTPNLPADKHSLLVTYMGNNSVTPLVLTNMYVTNVSIPSSSQSGSNGGTPSSGAGSGSGTVNGASSSSPPIGPILGGVLGGIFLVALALLFLYRRKKRREAQRKMEDPVVTGEISPFMPSFLTSANVHPSSPTQTIIPTPITKPRVTSSPVPYRGSSEIRLNASSIDFGGTMSRDAGLSVSAGSSELGVAGVGAAGVGYHWGAGGPPHPVRKGQEGRQEARDGAAAGQVPSAGGQNVVVRHHEDSGIRMPSDLVRVDVPPVYTAD